MKRSEALATDPSTLARLHAALDAVTDTEQMLAQIQQSSAVPQPAVRRVGALVAEAREALRLLLAQPRPALAVGTPNMRRTAGSR